MELENHHFAIITVVTDSGKIYSGSKLLGESLMMNRILTQVQSYLPIRHLSL